MKLKTVEIEGKVYAEVQDGNPVYEVDGKDQPIDAAKAIGKIPSLQAEAQRHREEKEKLEEVVGKFKGIEDPAAALKALETVSALDSKELIAAGKVDEIKAAAVKATEEKMAAAIRAKDEELAKIAKERDTVSSQLSNELIGGAFARSEFVREKVAIPADFLQARFGQNFKVEDGKAVAYDQSGNKIYSKTNPGDLANFDEAISILVDQYPQRDHILKGSQNEGAGANGGAGGNGGAKTIPRSQFNAMDQGARAAKLKDGYKVAD
jgi:hypothetical protein